MKDVCEKHDIDFYEITSMAYLDLLAQKSITYFPIEPQMYKNNKHTVISFQKYCSLADISLNDLTGDNTFEDGFTLQEIRPGLKLLLYNEDMLNARQNFTFMHEIAHLVLHHTQQGGKEETEANFFASQFLAPNCIIKEIRDRGNNINEEFFSSFFGLSCKAAKKKMNYLLRFPEIHPNEYDDMLIEKFYPIINEYFPNKNKYFHIDYFEEMEIERNNWSLR